MRWPCCSGCARTRSTCRSAAWCTPRCSTRAAGSRATSRSRGSPATRSSSSPGSGQATRDAAWIERHIGGDEFAALVDVTSAYSVISLMGPKSEALLRTLCPDDLSKAGLPFSMTAEIDVGYARVRAARMSYVGGPGYEMVVPTDQCVTLVRRARASAGDDFGLRDAGYYTIDALRIEAGRRAWGAGAVAGRNAAGSRARLRGEARQAGRLHRARRAVARSRAQACASGSCCSRSTIPPRFRGAASRSSWTGAMSASSRRPATAANAGRASRWATRAPMPDAPPLTDEIAPRRALRGRHRRRHVCSHPALAVSADGACRVIELSDNAQPSFHAAAAARPHAVASRARPPRRCKASRAACRCSKRSPAPKADSR